MGRPSTGPLRPLRPIAQFQVKFFDLVRRARSHARSDDSYRSPGDFDTQSRHAVSIGGIHQNSRLPRNSTVHEMNIAVKNILGSRLCIPGTDATCKLRR
jgi:hypothetical protein